MSKLAVKAQKVFGSSAAYHQISQFGSLAAASPAYTTDPDVIQGLANYLTGWFGGVVGSNSPAIEDMNALCFLFARQIAYLMQAGTPEWCPGTTYYAGSIVQLAGVDYVSITNDNTGNNPTGDTGGNWQIGPLIPSAMAMTTATMAAGSNSAVCNFVLTSSQTQTVPATSCLIVYNSIKVQSGGSLTVASGGQMRVI